MICTNCQTQMIPGGNFCQVCGKMLKPFCRSCRIELPPNSQYCFHCGEYLNLNNSQTLSTTTLPSCPTFFGANPNPGYPSQKLSPMGAPSQGAPTQMPDQLKEKIRKVESSIEGERKLVSMVFADISGFTAMSEKMDPEKVTDIMNECFRRLGKCVYDNEGYIDKFIGDCIMALFGAPIAHENDPELAVNSSLAMLTELKKFNDETGMELGISIGINSGIVVAGGVGTDQKFEYTVMGDAVNLAQRLEAAAGRGEILVSKNIFNACETIFQFGKLKPIRVKGKENKIEVFRVLGRAKAGAETRSSALNSRKLIGRDKEIQIAEGLLDQLEQSRGQIFFVAGEAGVGKSRFKHELKIKIQKKKMAWYEAKCQLLNKDTAYFPFIQLIQCILGIDPEDNLESQKKKMKQLDHYKLDEISQSLIHNLLGIPDPDDQNIQLDASQKKRAMFLAIKKLITASSSESPRVIYLEDLHWMDPISHELLGQVIDSIYKLPIMIYGSFRKDFINQWHDKRNVTQINLEPLTTEQVLELVKALLELDEIPKQLKKLVEKRCDGNPLYVEEIIKSLIDAGKIYKEEGKWEVSYDIQDAKIPSTLQGLIASRIDRLHESTKQVLQYASVIGRQFSDLLLSRATQLGTQLNESLQYLRKREMIFELSSEIDEIIYIFKHALTQEVAYDSILKKKRKIFHSVVAQTMEQMCKDAGEQRVEENLEALAHHYVRAEIPKKAIQYLTRSARKMADHFNNDGAIKNFKKAIELLESQDDLDSELMIDMLYQLAEIYCLIGEFEEAESAFLRLLKIGEKKRDYILASKACRRLGDLSRIRGQLDKAFALLDQSLEYSDKANDYEGRIRAYKAYGSVWQLAHEIPKAVEYFQKGLEGAKGLKNQHLIAEYLNDISIIYITKHELDEAEKLLKESIEISEKSNLKSLLISSTLNLGVIEYYRKNYKSAQAKFQEASKISAQIGDLKNVLISKHNIGEILREYGNDEEALQAFKESYELACDMGNDVEKLNNLILIGYLNTKQGHPDKGEQILKTAVADSAEKKYWPYHCDALYYLGKFYLETKQNSLAKESFLSSLAKAKEFKVESAVARAEEELKKLEDENKENVIPFKKGS